MSCLQNEILLETLYEEIVTESLQNLKQIGFKDVKESDLDFDSIQQEVMKRFEERG